jgi:DNA-binding NtrC family response regulator
MVWHFIQSRQRGLGRIVKQVPERAMANLVAYDGPGNIRELENVIDRALILSDGPALRLDEAFGPTQAPDRVRGQVAVEDLKATNAPASGRYSTAAGGRSSDRARPPNVSA